MEIIFSIYLFRYNKTKKLCLYIEYIDDHIHERSYPRPHENNLKLLFKVPSRFTSVRQRLDPEPSDVLHLQPLRDVAQRRDEVA